jgi:hypothetical protein
MELQFTKKYLKLFGKIRNERSKKETEKVINVLMSTPNSFELTNTNISSSQGQKLDVKKREIDGTYRIRYSGKPEMRIVFKILDVSTQKDKKQILELLWVGSRESYEIYAHSPINEEIEKKLVVTISESQFQRLGHLLNQ